MADNRLFMETTTTNSFNDSGLAANTTYLYRVRAVDTSGCQSAYTNTDPATTVTYAENVVAGVTIKAAHMLELKTAVNAVRTAAALSFVSVTTPLAVCAQPTRPADNAKTRAVNRSVLNIVTFHLGNRAIPENNCKGGTRC